jgi:hypothetical protein
MNGTAFRRRIAQGLCVAAIGLAAAGAAQAAGCVDARERDSMSVRALQTRLMVAALACNARDNYNEFVNRYRPHLAGHGRALRGYFERSFGRGAQRALDVYVTDLANRASQLSNADRGAFCAHSADSLTALLAAAKHDGAHVLAQMAGGLPVLAGRDPGPGCDALTRR